MDQDYLYESLLQEISEGWQGLPDKPDETPRSTLNTLWELASGTALTMPEAGEQVLPALDLEARERLQGYIRKRLEGIPLAYITGRQSFLGLDLLAGPEAMIPRRETEIVGRAAIEAARELAAQRGEIRVVDLCTGSGNLALAVAWYESQSRVTGVDLSEEAVCLARRNADYLQVDDRVDFVCGDLFTPLDSPEYLDRLDLLICNPPYISSAHVDRMPEEIRGHEPRLAFDGGPYGVGVISRLVREGQRFLKPGSYLCFEVGLGQGLFASQMVRKNSAYSSVETFPDEQGEIRCIRARRVER